MNLIKEDYYTSPGDLVNIMEKRNKSLKLFKSRSRKSIAKPYNIYLFTDLPDKMKDEEMGIIFLFDHGTFVTRENIDGPISGHWVGYFNSPTLQHVYYFDPLSLDVPSSVEKFLRTANKSGRMNERFQPLESSKCGLYVTDILTDLNSLTGITDDIVFDIIGQYYNLDFSEYSMSEKIYNEIKVLMDTLK